MSAPEGGPRAALQRAILERRTSLAALSRSLGRNPAYLQQWIARESPRVLPERDRRALAAELDIPEADLMEPDLCQPAPGDDDLIEELARGIWERDPENLRWPEAGDHWRGRYRQLARWVLDAVRPMVRDGRIR